MSIRKSVVSGSFYPNEKKELLKYFEKFNQEKSSDLNLKDISAILVPHAGYIYSGFTANKAFKVASLKNYKKVVIVGPSHKVWFKGASISLYDFYETPFGDLKVDLEYSKELLKIFDFLTFEEECSFEHSTEVQAPFCKYYFNSAKIVEIIYGDISSDDLVKLYEYIQKDSNNLLVISSDLSHFYSLNDAMKLDINCLNAVKNFDLKSLEFCEACGKTAIEAIIKLGIKQNLKSKLLHYCTSADISNDKTKVVGYTSAIFTKE